MKRGRGTTSSCNNVGYVDRVNRTTEGNIMGVGGGTQGRGAKRMVERVVARWNGADCNPWAFVGYSNMGAPRGRFAADLRKWGPGRAGRDPPNPQMSQHVARDLIFKIARHARDDGSILSIDTTNNSLERMEVRKRSHGLHLDLQTFEIWRF